ncbi:MAG TPA: TPM domain-containing protein [Ignavibacteria bacterium]|nr:TPM domain-containing protein [Ignavibacteria bacterium]
MKKNYLKDFLAEEDFEKISSCIAEVEKKTSGEIRVCIKRKRGLFENGKDTRELAIKEFAGQEMHKTIDKTGVMIFILLDEHKFEIIADEGINSKISRDKWDVITTAMSTEFAHGKFAEGICDAVESIGLTLILEFPRKSDDKDELSNEIIVK